MIPADEDGSSYEGFLCQLVSSVRPQALDLKLILFIFGFFNWLHPTCLKPILGYKNMIGGIQ